MMSISRAASAALLVSAWALTGCGVLGSDKPTPAALEPFTPTARVQTLWSTTVSPSAVMMVPSVADELMALAGSDGTVTVRHLADGRPVWTTPLGQSLSAGVGFDGVRAAVVTTRNELVVLDGGKVLWRKPLTSRVTTPPLVAGERVFVLGLDRAVDAFDATDGRYLWRLQRSTDPLTLQLPGVLLAMGNNLMVGQGARLAAVDPLDGNVRWEVPLATARGSNEVERLSDLVGPALRLGDQLCARSFQLAVACVDTGSVALKWSRNVGGATAIGGARDVIVGADASSRMSAWRTDTGEVLWNHERLLHREVSGVSAWGDWVVVGDAQGVVHIMNRQTGDTVGRLNTDGSAIVTPPRVVGRTLVVITRKGGVFAWRAA